jgi:hypothetical protein
MDACPVGQEDRMGRIKLSPSLDSSKISNFWTDINYINNQEEVKGVTINVNFIRIGGIYNE